MARQSASSLTTRERLGWILLAALLGIIASGKNAGSVDSLARILSESHEEGGEEGELAGEGSEEEEVSPVSTASGVKNVLVAASAKPFAVVDHSMCS